MINELERWVWEWFCILSPIAIGWFIATKVKPNKPVAILIAIIGALVFCLPFILTDKLISPMSLGVGFTGLAMLFTGIYFSYYADSEGDRLNLD